MKTRKDLFASLFVLVALASTTVSAKTPILKCRAQFSKVTPHNPHSVMARFITTIFVILFNLSTANADRCKDYFKADLETLYHQISSLGGHTGLSNKFSHETTSKLAVAAKLGRMSATRIVALYYDIREAGGYIGLSNRFSVETSLALVKAAASGRMSATRIVALYYDIREAGGYNGLSNKFSVETSLALVQTAAIGNISANEIVKLYSSLNNGHLSNEAILELVRESVQSNNE